MDITLVVRPSAGGIRQHVQWLVEALPSCAFTLRANPGFWKNSLPKNVSFVPFNIRSSTHPLIDYKAIRELRSELGNTQVVHAHGVRAGLIGCIAARQANIPSILTVHNSITNASLLQKLALQIVFKSSSVIIAVSQAVADSLLKLGAPNSSIQVIGNGIPLHSFPYGRLRDKARAALNLPQQAHVVIALGRLSPEKGFDLLSESMAIVRETYPDSFLLLGGTGTEESKLSLLLENHPKNRMCGYIDNPASFLSAGDVVVIPSRTEGQSLVALEAMALGIPVVASAVGGLIETFGAGRYGILTEAESPKAVATGILKILHDDIGNSELTKSARSYVESTYSLDIMSNRVSRVYTEIAERKNATSR